ncbi:MAG TPA: hypothetical protein ENN42_06425 [Thioalkalivibrio sp.]|nr:hypothetical protein [Thioalkalivibrio sp.]
MSRLLLVVLLLFTLALPALAEGPELPPAPQGYSWKQLEPVDAHVLIPEGWHFRQEENDGTLAYFVTETAIEPGELFDVGLSVNVVPQLKARTRQHDAPTYAQAYIQQCARTHAGAEAWQFEQAPFVGYGCEFTTEPKPGHEITMYMLALGNRQTDTLYVMWFEAPAARWEDAWQTGRVMLQGFALEDGF